VRAGARANAGVDTAAWRSAGWEPPSEPEPLATPPRPVHAPSFAGGAREHGIDGGVGQCRGR
jgi:hypothetical protein